MEGYTVFYIEAAFSKRRYFKTEKLARSFISRFIKKHANEGVYSDNWVDCLVHGKVVESYV